MLSSGEKIDVKAMGIADILACIKNKCMHLLIKFDIEGAEDGLFRNIYKGFSQQYRPSHIYMIGEVHWDTLRLTEEDFEKMNKELVDSMGKISYDVISGVVGKYPVGSSRDKPFCRCSPQAGTVVEYLFTNTRIKTYPFK